MKRNDCKFLALLLPLFLMACNGNAKDGHTGTSDSSAQTVFSVEKVSKEEFIQAYETSKEYNAYPQEIDSVAQHKVLAKIFQNAREHLAALDSVERDEIFYAVPENELYRVDNLLCYPDLKLLGFGIPLEPHNNTVWWYDSTTGDPIRGTSIWPTAVNSNGIFVCQVLADCDITMDLQFYQQTPDPKYGRNINIFQSYNNNGYNGEYYVPEDENSGYRRIFWHKNNTLYFQTYEYGSSGPKLVYLKISVNHQG